MYQTALRENLKAEMYCVTPWDIVGRALHREELWISGQRFRRQNPGSCASKMGEKCQSYLYAGAGRTKRADHKRKLSGIG